MIGLILMIWNGLPILRQQTVGGFVGTPFKTRYQLLSQMPDAFAIPQY
jgi:hypothetical protein